MEKKKNLPNQSVTTICFRSVMSIHTLLNLSSLQRNTCSAQHCCITKKKNGKIWDLVSGQHFSLYKKVQPAYGTDSCVLSSFIPFFFFFSLDFFLVSFPRDGVYWERGQEIVAIGKHRLTLLPLDVSTRFLLVGRLYANVVVVVVTPDVHSYVPVLLQIKHVFISVCTRGKRARVQGELASRGTTNEG